MKSVMLIGLMILLANCAATGGAGCEAWRPILVTDQEADALRPFPDLARAILAHNRTGRALCGW